MVKKQRKSSVPEDSQRPTVPSNVPGTPPPFTGADIPDLIAGLQAGAVDPLWVHQRIIETVRGGRLWGTPEWKELRQRLIKDACEQCGTIEGPMTLQHLWHPTLFTEIVRHLHDVDRQATWQSYYEENVDTDGLQDVLEPVGPERPGCPVCGGYNVQRRKKTAPHWKCQTVRDRRICGAEFDEPITTRATRHITAHALRWQAFSTQYTARYRARERAVLTEAAITALEQHVAYLSGEGTLTFCKKCAYLWDEKGVRLCQECRDGYHPHDKPHCQACATGGQWVLCSVCQENRHLDTYPTCWSCIPGNDLRNSEFEQL